MAKRGPKEKLIDPSEVEHLAAMGLKKQEIAGILGMSGATFYLRQSQNSEISDAYLKGRSKGIGQVTKNLFQKATRGNVTAQIFFLKNVARWDDTNPANRLRESEEFEIASDANGFIKQATTIEQRMHQGQISLNEARGEMALLADKAKIVEINNQEARIRALEEKANVGKKN